MELFKGEDFNRSYQTDFDCKKHLAEAGKVKRFYALQIKDFSTKSLRPIFDKHIAKEVEMTTYEWKEYGQISKQYSLKQVPSEMGLKFEAIHTMSVK